LECLSSANTLAFPMTSPGVRPWFQRPVWPDLAGVSREEHDRLRGRPDLESVGAAVQLLTNAAHAMGYGACWMRAPIVAAERLEKTLDVKPPAKLVALVPIGRPSGAARRSRRLPLRTEPGREAALT